MKIFKKAKEKAIILKQDITALYYAGKSPDLPVKSRMLIVVTVAYALSPVDLIPDFIPIIGYLDDLVILPILITLCLRSIPESILNESKFEAARNPIQFRKNWKAGAGIILIWVFILWMIFDKMID